MNKFVNKLYVEPFVENTEDDFQDFVDLKIRQTLCINCGKPYHENLKVMWVDLSSGRILWWCLGHSVMWGSLSEKSK